MYQSSPFRSTLNTGYITALDMCEVCIGAGSPCCSTLNTGYITALDMCEVCKYVLVQAVHAVALWTRVIHYSLRHVWSMYRRSPFRSTLNTGEILHLWTFEHGFHYSFGHVWSIYQSSPFRSSLNRGYITALDMCVCTEAVHSVALWTRVPLQL